VATTRAQRQSITAWAFAEGTIHAWRRAYVQSDVAGIVASLGVVDGQAIREGIHVKGADNDLPGDMLVRLDSRVLMTQEKVFDAELKGARLDLAQAERNYKRTRALYDKNLISRSDFEQSLTVYQTAQAKVKASEAQKERSRVNIEKSIIRSPIDGVIKRINVREGDYFAGASQWTSDSDREANALVVIIDTQQMEAVLNIPLWDAEQVKIGQRVYLASSSRTLSKAAHSGFDQGRFAVGKVYAKSPSISLDKRSIEVKVRTTEGTQYLNGGSHITAWIVTDQRQNVVTIPHLAVVGREVGEFAYVYDSGSRSVVERKLTIGAFGLDTVEIIDGIREGEAVVIEGVSNLTDGTPVKVVRTDDEKK
jgi:RND family efflux transporter MFP subunit